MPKNYTPPKLSTQQEVYDYVKEYFQQFEGNLSTSEGAIRYPIRVNGRRKVIGCAIGCLIQDKHAYEVAGSVAQPDVQLALRRSQGLADDASLDIGFLRALQETHDRCSHVGEVAYALQRQAREGVLTQYRLKP